MRDLAFVVGLAAMLPFIFGRPHVGVLLWAWTAFLVPNALLFGFAQTTPFNLIVAMTTLGAWVFSHEKVRIPLNCTVVLLILLALFATASTSLAIGNSAVAWGEWEKLIKIILFALVVSALITSKMKFIALVFAVILSLGFLGFVEGLKVLATGGSHRLVGPGRSVIADNNHFALAMLCTIPLVFFAFRQTSHAALRAALIMVGIVLVFAVVGTFSRGGLIGLTAMVGWGFIRSSRKLRYFAFVAPIVLAVVVFVPSSWIERMDSISQNLEGLAAGTAEESSFMSRVVAWKQSTLVALDNPVLGGGFHALQDHAVWNHYRGRQQDLSFVSTPEPGTIGRAAHSIYFQVLGDLGFVGLVLFGTLALSAWINARKIIAVATKVPDLSWAGQLALCIQYSLVGYYVAGAALSMAYFELIYVFFAMLTSLRLCVEQYQAKTTRQIQGVSHAGNSRF